MNSERILGRSGLADARWLDLHGSAATRALEKLFVDARPTLMQRAGLATARLALALAPHARTVWVACGPGNNAGDGFAAAAQLAQRGKRVVVSSLTAAGSGSPETEVARAAAISSGAVIMEGVPADFDFCIDALFGLGSLRPIEGAYRQWIAQINAAPARVLSIDLPSGLDADTGCVQDCHVRADYTLSLLTLKPGLFTHAGRDASGDIWFNNLDCDATPIAIDARLIAAPVLAERAHASHKGSFGDVAVIGGAAGMSGAALLAACAALHGGAGRVFACLLDTPDPGFLIEPELMLRSFETLALGQQSVVAGCGGGTAMEHLLPRVLNEARHLVLDADALNLLSSSPALQQQLAQRAPDTTVLTPHPLEAARLLGCTTAQIQADRLRAAHALARRWNCTVVLKGSGSVVCAPGQAAHINPTGNARLATAGTGDVLAGLTGARLAQGESAFAAACSAVWLHGRAAEQWNARQLTAGQLARALPPDTPPGRKQPASG